MRAFCLVTGYESEWSWLERKTCLKMIIINSDYPVDDFVYDDDDDDDDTINIWSKLM